MTPINDDRATLLSLPQPSRCDIGYMISASKSSSVMTATTVARVSS
jgi:hypothetical protein